MEKKQNRSKYGFGKLEEGSEIHVEVVDVHSMLIALNAFNKRHDRDIVIEPTGEVNNGKVKCIVNKI